VIKMNFSMPAALGSRIPRAGASLAVISGMLLVSACVGPSGPDVQPANVAEWGPPGDYKLQPGDDIEIKLFRSPELNERQTIRDDGKISAAVIPDVQAAGYSVAELAEHLRQVYLENKVKSPDVKVYLRVSEGNRIAVTGEVVLQGVQALQNSTTVTQAIAQAQGLKPTAYSSEVLVIRPLPGGKRLVRTVNYSAVLDGTAAAQDVYLQPRDIVYVPMSPIAHVDQFVDQYVRQALPGTVSGGAVYQFGNGALSSATTSTTGK
jgi:protein involved in polysaccharide export with SLBB domain